MYKNRYIYDGEPILFPYFPLNNNAILPMDTFKNEVSLHWESYIQSVQNTIALDESPTTLDLNFINNPNDYNYQSLFKKNKEGIEAFNQVLKSFMGWWNSFYSGYRVIDYISGKFIPEIGTNIDNKLLKKHNRLPNYNLFLIAVYDKVPFNLKNAGRNFIIEPISHLDLTYQDENRRSNSIGCLVDKLTQHLIYE